MTRVEHRSQDHTWQTPDNVLERVRLVAPIALDPCTVPENPTQAQAWLTPDDEPDGLTADWTGRADGRLIFCNPPYGRDLARLWVPKIVAEARQGARIISLVPARTDTQWFKQLVARAKLVCFWEGRLTFKGATAPAPFPSMLVLHGNHAGDERRFAVTFHDAGHVWTPRPVLKGHR